MSGGHAPWVNDWGNRPGRENGDWRASHWGASYMTTSGPEPDQSQGAGRLLGEEDSRRTTAEAVAGADHSTSVPTTRLATAGGGPGEAEASDPWLAAARQLVSTATHRVPEGPASVAATWGSGGASSSAQGPAVGQDASALMDLDYRPCLLQDWAEDQTFFGLLAGFYHQDQIPFLIDYQIMRDHLMDAACLLDQVPPEGGPQSWEDLEAVNLHGWISERRRLGILTSAATTMARALEVGLGGTDGIGWTYRRQWVTAVRRWNKQTDVPVFRRAEKVLRTLGWEQQVDFEHLTEQQLGSDLYLEYILQVIELKAGVREDDERRQAYRAVMHECSRKRDETLAQYSMRRLRDFTKAAAVGIQLPDEFKATMLREGAGLSDQGLQNLTALMQGRDHDLDRLATTLARMDARADRLVGFVEQEERLGGVRGEDESFLEGHSEEEEAEGDLEEFTEDEHVLSELMDMSFSEEQAALVFAIVENRPPHRRRTWKENKKFKAELRKDRNSFVKGAEGPPRSNGQKPRYSKEQLKKISKCRNCGRRGHWAEDCRQPKGSTPSENGKVTGFCYLGDSRDRHVSFTFAATESVSMAGSLESWCLLTIPSGLAILDIGATQDIIGKDALVELENELEKCGLRAIEIPDNVAIPTGIGGQAKVDKVVLVPIAPGGIPGVVKFVVLENNVPPLLSVGLLTHLGASLDLQTDVISFKKIGVSMKMQQLPSGHRAIPLVQWSGEHFPVPAAAKRQYQLSDDAFMKEHVPVAYTKRKAPSRSTEGARSSVNQSRWRGILLRMFQMLETVRVGYMRLAEAETQQKSIVSKRKKYLTADSQEPDTCLHPGQHIRRSNQYAVWTVCPKCSARTSYVSKYVPRSKAKARARARDPNGTAGYPVVSTTTTTSSGTQERAARNGPPTESVPIELNHTLQTMMAGFQDIGASLRALAQGQGQMLIMLQKGQQLDLSNMTPTQVAEAVNRTVNQEMQEMLVDETGSSPGTWSPVSPMSNPNERDLPASTGHGGNPSCWFVKRDWSMKEPEERPAWLRVPWVQAMTFDEAVDKDLQCLWHVTREDGDVYSKGPGPPEPGGSSSWTWACSRGERVLQDAWDRITAPLGLGVDGQRSHVGPYWMVHAPGLDEEGNLLSSWEKSEAEAAALRLARTKCLETNPDKIDYVNLFHQAASTERVRDCGGLVASSHERFTREDGWKIENKEHRARLRKFLDRRQPEMVFVAMPKVHHLSYGSNVKQSLYEDMAWEVAAQQDREGRSYLVQGKRSSPMWQRSSWRALLEDPKTMVVSGKELKWVTNDPARADRILKEKDDLESEPDKAPQVSYHQAPSERKSSIGENIAKQLLEQQDFSLPACLKLLKAVEWPGKSRRRSSSGNNEAVLLGQFSHGKFSGITRATREFPSVTQYVNEFMRRRGALLPRSSIMITRNNAYGYHRDSHNIGENQTMGLGEYSGGEVWIEDEKGKQRRRMPHGTFVNGRVVKTKNRIVTFNAKNWHGVEPWRGDRWSINVFKTRSAANLSQGYSEPSAPKKMADVLVPSWWFSPENSGGKSFPTLSLDEEEDDTTPAAIETTGHEKKITEEQKALVKKVHVNTGHPPRDRMLRTFRAAGAKAEVLKYIRDEFACDHCIIKRGPDHRRKAQCPRIFTFNRVVSVDVFYIHFQDRSIPVLNMVCHGTGYQIAQRITGSGDGAPTAAATWSALLTTWARFLGPPALLITDGGKEFQGVFERGLEQLGTLQHVTAPESPWQNSRAERHGGWLKHKLQQEIESGQCTLSSESEFDDFMASLVAAKNRWHNAGGYTPTQLVFGELPRIPGELLAEDSGGMVPLSDAYHDAAGLDAVGVEFRKRQEIRERAKQLAMQATSKEAIVRATKTSSTPLRQWNAGQWVYCFRRGKAGDTLHPVPRWVGPGMVVLSSRSIVWVAMRSRLWRCTPEQLRPAFPSEVLGRELASDPELADLLRRVVSGGQTEAVDVTRERPPAQTDQLMPVQEECEGIPVSAERPTEAELHRQTLRGEEAIPVPPGIIPEVHGQSDRHEDEPAGHEGRMRRQVSTSTGSRRSSVQEPAQEPEATGGLQPVPEHEELHPPYDHEDHGAGVNVRERSPPAEERAFKALRVGEPREESGSRAASPTEQPSSSNRAPGTPISRLLDAVRRGRDQADPGSATVEEDSDAEGMVSWYSFNEDGGLTLVASRSDEIDVKKLSEDEQKMFEQSDEMEWSAILKTKAVRVIVGQEAATMRKRYPERVLNSRMVRRRKPQPGEGSWKAKSRWCLAGHGDPDTAELTTFAPTPSTEGMMAFMQAGINMGHHFIFSDVKNAFCQSDKLHRPRGPIFAEPCEGLKLPAGSLIVIEVPVYGLDDAPAAWRNTVTKYLADNGFVRNLVEPCWWMRFNEQGTNEAQILIEVDDFIISALPEMKKQIKELLHARFKFGKWEEDEAEYAGRRIRTSSDRILVDQEKYIKEQIFPVPISKSRKGDKSVPLTMEEFKNFRSAIYKINWVAKETRPEVSGTASLMASKLTNATIDDVMVVNKTINYLRNTASRPLVIWKFHPSNMAFIAVSDAGGVGQKYDSLDEEGLPTDGTQGAWMVMAAECLPIGNQRVKATPLAWRSSRLKRKVFSTFGGETQAMLQAINEVDWLQIMMRDAVQHDIELNKWRNSLSPHLLIMKGDMRATKQPQCSVTDAKSLYDCIMKEHPQGRQDRKSALELAIIVKDLQSSQSMVRWIPHQKMIVDALTKADPAKSNGAMDMYLRSGTLSLVDVAAELSCRAADAKYKNRSHAASVARLVKEYQQAAMMSIAAESGQMSEEEITACTKVAEPAQTAVVAALREVEVRLKSATLSMKEELVALKDRGMEMKKKCETVAATMRNQRQGISAAQMAATISEKVALAEEGLAACQDAEMPFLKGIEVLPAEESTKAISDCESASTKAELALNQARGLIRQKQTDAKKFPKELQEKALAELSQLSQRAEACGKKVADFKKETAERKLNALMAEVMESLKAAETKVQDHAEVAKVFSDDLNHVTEEAVKEAMEKVGAAEKEALDVLTEARKQLTAKQKDVKGPAAASAMSKLQGRLKTAADELTKNKKATTFGDKLLKGKEALAEEVVNVDKAEAEVAKAEKLAEPVEAVENPTDEECAELGDAIVLAQNTIKATTGSIQANMATPVPSIKAAFSKVAERSKKVQERLDKVLAGKKGLRERSLGEAYVREGKKKTDAVDGFVEKVNDAELPFLKGIEVLPLTEATSTIDASQKAATDLQNAISEARNFIAAKNVELKGFSDKEKTKPLIEELTSLTGRINAAATKLASFRKDTDTRKKNALLQEAGEKIAHAEKQVEMVTEAAAPLTDEAAEEMTADEAANICEKAGAQAKAAQAAVDESRTFLSARTQENKGNPGNAETIKSLQTRLNTAGTALSKAKKVVSNQEHKFVAKKLLHEVEEMLGSLEAEVKAAEEVCAPLLDGGGVQFLVAGSLKTLAGALRSYMKDKGLDTSALFTEASGGNRPISKEDFLSYLQKLPQAIDRPEVEFTEAQFCRMSGEGKGKGWGKRRDDTGAEEKIHQYRHSLESGYNANDQSDGVLKSVEMDALVFLQIMKHCRQHAPQPVTGPQTLHAPNSAHVRRHSGCCVMASSDAGAGDCAGSDEADEEPLRRVFVRCLLDVSVFIMLMLPVIFLAITGIFALVLGPAEGWSVHDAFGFMCAGVTGGAIQIQGHALLPKSHINRMVAALLGCFGVGLFGLAIAVLSALVPNRLLAATGLLPKVITRRSPLRLAALVVVVVLLQLLVACLFGAVLALVEGWDFASAWKAAISAQLGGGLPLAIPIPSQTFSELVLVVTSCWAVGLVTLIISAASSLCTMRAWMKLILSR
ncbi:RE1 [Symbiodinium natans]|uniref:RE1 protein n=1 Tax=Symbiodinium natans TaxID=878477 RepID=A0A812PTV8_9DINO|nr:RE1 [Symbiodinium natans]